MVTHLPEMSIVQICRDFRSMNDDVCSTQNPRLGKWYMFRRSDTDEYCGEPSHRTHAFPHGTHAFLCPGLRVMAVAPQDHMDAVIVVSHGEVHVRTI